MEIIYREIIILKKKKMNVPVLTNDEFYHSLPSLSELYENVSEIKRLSLLQKNFKK